MDGDSIVYATISKTIAVEGNWLTPVYQFRNFFDHPPLVFWVNALLFKLVGSEEWVAKLFSGLCGLGVVLLVFHMGTRYANPYVGFYGGLSMLFTYDFVKYLNKCRLDMPLVLFFTCALYFFLRGVEGNKKGFPLCGVFAGFCFLTTGVVAGGVFLTGFLLLLDLKKLSLLKKKEIWIGVFISLAIPGLWILAQFQANGREFFDQYFLWQVSRSLMGRNRPYGIFYYAGHLLQVYWPWLPFFIHGVVISFKETEKTPLWRMAMIWSAVVFLAFSVVKFKIHYYLLPMFPAMSLLVGRSLDHWLSVEKKQAGIKIIAMVGIIASLFLAVSPITFHHNRYPEIYKMAPYLKEVFTEEDLILVYRDQAGITTPALYLINDKLEIHYTYKVETLRNIIDSHPSRRIFLYADEQVVKEEPDVFIGFFPFIENNGKRFYSQDPNLRLSGSIP